LNKEKGVTDIASRERGRTWTRSHCGAPLDTHLCADIMSDMKTFTVRELDRSPGEVLEASRLDGKARIRARGGQTYIILPEAAPSRRITALPNFAARRAALLPKPLSSEFARKFDRALAGE
jgi:hypothetical protein